MEYVTKAQAAKLTGICKDYGMELAESILKNDSIPAECKTVMLFNISRMSIESIMLVDSLEIEIKMALFETLNEDMSEYHKHLKKTLEAMKKKESKEKEGKK